MFAVSVNASNHHFFSSMCPSELLLKILISEKDCVLLIADWPNVFHCLHLSAVCNKKACSHFFCISEVLVNDQTARTKFFKKVAAFKLSVKLFLLAVRQCSQGAKELRFSTLSLQNMFLSKWGKRKESFVKVGNKMMLWSPMPTMCCAADSCEKLLPCCLWSSFWPQCHMFSSFKAKETTRLNNKLFLQFVSLAAICFTAD